MAWDVLNLLKKYKQIAFLQILGTEMGTAQTCTVLVKDRWGNALVARTEDTEALPQKRRGFAKGCLLFVNGSGPDDQNTKGLYENVGNALVSRFNVIGQIADPEILLANGQILIGNAQGISQNRAISGDVALTNAGVTSLNLADGKIYIGDATNKAAAKTLSGVISITREGVASFNGLYANSHRLVSAGQSVSENDADASVVITDAAVEADDIILCTIANQSGTAAILKAVATQNTITVTLSGNGGANTVINYAVLRPVGETGTTAAPTTPAP